MSFLLRLLDWLGYLLPGYHPFDKEETEIWVKYPAEILWNVRLPVDARRQILDELWQRWQNLSAREHDVAMGVYYDYSTDDIATRLDVTANTVKSHIYKVMRKLGVHNRDSLRALLIEMNVGQDE